MNKLYLLLLFLVVLFKASGQPGSLDPGFGNNGIVKTAFLDTSNNLSELGHVVLTDANGEIFVVVQLGGHPSYTRIAKYSPGGRLDSSYGNGGYSNSANLDVTSAVMQGDKIIIAGGIYVPGIGDDFGLARYTADGVLDVSFGVNGIVQTDFDYSSDDRVNAVALQGDKIIAGGYSWNSIGVDFYDFALARYTTNGILDSTFGENGKVVTNFNGNSNDRVNAIALQGDKIIAGGYTDNSFPNYNDIALARYTAEGSLDYSFGANGTVTTDFYNSDNRVNAMVLQGDKIIVGGYTYLNFITDFMLARYSADGCLDSSFGVNGIVATDFNNSYDYANAMALQGDKIILAGETTADIALACYTADGALDSSFGENGKVVTDLDNTEDHAYSITLQGDKIIIGGSTFYYVNGFPSDFALVRYVADGTLDASFGSNGKLADHFPVNRTYFTSMAIQGNKIIAAGYNAVNYFITDFALARYTSDGTLDSSFGLNGKVLTNFDSSAQEVDQKITSVVMQGDKIIAGGYAGDLFNGYDFVLARYTADGALDSTFGENGKVTTYFINSSIRTNSIALQGNNILVTGFAFNQDNFTTDFALVRYTADGKLDSAFGQNGIATTDFNSAHDRANAITLQGDKIIVCGSSENFGSEDFALTRYTADGILDASFGQNGIVTTDIDNADDRATAITLQADKIIVGGYTGDIFNDFDFVLVRYSADGIPDAFFGENGIVTSGFNSSLYLGGANSIANQDGKIIVGGKFSNSDFSFERYTADGFLDASFGKNGKVTTNLIGSSTFDDITVYQNRLYAAGSLTYGQDESYGVVAAYQLEAQGPAITIEDITVPESKRLAVVTVRLSADATQRVRVHFTTRNKTATSPQDYINISGPLLFIPGFNTKAKVFIPIINNNIIEDAEQLEIVLTDATHATILDSIAVVTILDDDSPAAKQVDPLHINASPNPFTYRTNIQLHGGNSMQPVTVQVFDISSGRLMEKRNNINIGQSLQIGDQYKPGSYIIEAVQGGQRMQIQVIKSGK